MTLQLRDDTKLPDNASPTIRQTSLLGEKFVVPRRAAQRREQQPADQRRRDPAGAHRAQPRGRGGAGRAQPAAQRRRRGPAARPSRTSSTRRPARPRGRRRGRCCTRSETLMAQLDDNKADDRRRDRLAQPAGGLARTPAAATIDAALDELPERADRRSTSSATTWSGCSRPWTASAASASASSRPRRTSTIETLRQLEPGADRARRLRRATSSTPSTSFLTYPFVDEVVGRDPQVARNLHMGDYTNLSIKLDVDARPARAAAGLPTALPTLPTLPTSCRPDGHVLDDVSKCLQSGNVDSTACKKVLGDAGRAAPAARGVQEEEEPRQAGLQAAQRRSAGSRPAAPALPSLTPARPACPRCRVVRGLGRPSPFGRTDRRWGS